MSMLICPSLMCANFANLQAEIEALEAAGTDIFHIDIMDGKFVPNFGMGLQDLELIRAVTNKTIDVHLMIDEPGNYVEFFADKGADIIYFHPEADRHPTRTIEKIRNKNKHVGLAINPGTSIETIRELLPLIDYLMIMSVNPGFAGQQYVSSVDDKICRLASLITEEELDVTLMIDGAISEEKISYLRPMGITGFVLGTSTLFNQTEDYQTIINRLRKEVIQ